MAELRHFRTPDGKRTRDPEEFIRSQGDDPVSKVVIYNRQERMVMEGWKNMKTKHFHLTKVRRPTGEEEKQFDSMILRDRLTNRKDNQDQIELIVGGADYKKRPLKSK